MTPPQLAPGARTDLTWLEATQAGDWFRDSARMLRATALTYTPPKRGWIARLEYAAEMRAWGRAAHRLDELACTYYLHAAKIREEAR